MLRLLPALTVLSLALACKQADPGARPSGTTPQAAEGATTAAAAPVSDSLGILAKADSGRIQGEPSAPVWVIVASDFQCPFCRVWHEQTYPMIVRDYVRTGRVRIAYLNFPLRNHQHAVKTAEAAMCAAVQGRFWEMHDGIFDTQERWSAMTEAQTSALLDSLAEGVATDANAWRRCMNDHSTLPLITADAQRTAAAGVQSTPSFYIGGRSIAGAQPPEVFREAIEAALAEARAR